MLLRSARHRWWVMILATMMVATHAASRAQGQAPLPVPRTVAGIVVSDSGTPLAAAAVSLSGTEAGVEFTAHTDGNGRFAFANVPAGRYVLAVSRQGFASMEYGANRFDRPGMTVVVPADDPLPLFHLALPRLAAIGGVVRQPDGTPMHLARVTATAAAPTTPGASASTWSSAATNERGEYRLPGLPPGAYLIHASVAYQAPTDRNGPLRGVYHPDAVDAAGATVVAVGPGDERTGIDLTLQRARPMRISGNVLNVPPGTAPDLYLLSGGSTVSVASPDASGRFTFTDVLPGTYTIETGLIAAPPDFFVPDKKPASHAAAEVPAKVLAGGRFPPIPTAISSNGGERMTASTITRQLPPAVGSWGRADVQVEGYDVEGVIIDLRKTVTVRGRVIVDAPALPSADLSRVVIALRPPAHLEHLQARLGFPMPARRLRTVPDEKGAFVVQQVVPSRFRVEVAAAGADEPRWFLKSATLAGQDVTDVEFEVAPDRSISDLAITITTVTQRLTGTFLDDAGRVPAAMSLVAFPADRRFWLHDSRRIRVAARATDGTFAIEDLPAGEYSLAAFAGAEPDDLSAPRFLEPLAAAAIRVTVVAGEHTVQHVRVGRQAP